MPLFRKKEADYAAQGVTIGNGTMKFEQAPLIWASWGIGFHPAIRITMEGGFSMQEESRIDAGGAVGVGYSPEFLRTGRLQGFVGVGLAVFRGYIVVRYNSPLKYGTLDGVEVTVQKTGGFLRGGMDWEIARDVAVEGALTYYLVSPAASTAYPGSVNFSCFSAGATLMFNFMGGATP